MCIAFCKSRTRQGYCEKTLSDVVVDSMSIVRSMSIVSMMPALRSVISKVHGSPAVVTLHVAFSSVILVEGLTFSPLYLVIAAPNTSCSITSSTVLVVVVVAVILPCVNAGVICWAAALAGSNRRSSSARIGLTQQHLHAI